MDASGYEFESGYDGAGDGNYGGGDYGGGYGGGNYGGGYGAGNPATDHFNPIFSPAESSVPGLDLNRGGLGVDFGGSSLYPDATFESGPVTVVATSTDRFNLHFGTLTENNGFATESFGYLETSTPRAGYGNMVASAGGIALPMPGAGAGAGDALGALGRLLTGAGLMAVPIEAGRGSDSLSFYHGTGAVRTQQLGSGAPLDVSIAKGDLVEGPLGFYMTPETGNATYYAENRGNYATLVKYEITFDSLAVLKSAGAEHGRTGQISRYGTPFIELIIRAEQFPLFNSLLVGGKIVPSIIPQE